MTSNLSKSGVSGSDWSEQAGRRWVEVQNIIEGMIRPLSDALFEAAAPAPGMRILDVGCGTGETTASLAQRVGPNGATHGIDISSDMLAAAQKKAEGAGVAVTFHEGDAQSFAFEPLVYDLIFSRFGVMFFEDADAAFANLARATKAGGRFTALVWRSAEEIPFMTAGERAAAPLLPDLAPRTDDAAGQFGFANAERVAGILERSGWRNPAAIALDEVCSLSKADLPTYVGALGPVGRIMPSLSEAKRAEVMGAVVPAFDEFVDGEEVRFTAACWILTADRG
ncbi:MAG: class I SAM-dependent methyltransferase [Pseudomonadota bacterium]